MTWWHKAALGTIPVVGIFVCVLLFQASALVERANRDEGTLAAGLQTALETINAECGVSSHCGTLAEVDKTLTHTSDLIVQTQIAVRHADQVSQTEAKMLPEWNRRITGTLDGIDTAVGDLNANQSKLVAATLPILSDADQTVKHLDELVASPYIVESLHNIDTSTAAIADSAKHADAVAGDIQFEADKLAHPAKKKLGFWGGIWAGAQVIHKLSPPLF